MYIPMILLDPRPEPPRVHDNPVAISRRPSRLSVRLRGAGSGRPPRNPSAVRIGYDVSGIASVTSAGAPRATASSQRARTSAR